REKLHRQEIEHRRRKQARGAQQFGREADRAEHAEPLARKDEGRDQQQMDGIALECDLMGRNPSLDQPFRGTVDKREPREGDKGQGNSEQAALLKGSDGTSHGGETDAGRRSRAQRARFRTLTGSVGRASLAMPRSGQWVASTQPDQRESAQGPVTAGP